jgi:hypothetical protein
MIDLARVVLNQNHSTPRPTAVKNLGSFVEIRELGFDPHSAAERTDELSDDVRFAQIVQRLGGGVDLVIVLDAQKPDEFGNVIVEPRNALWQKDAAILEPIAAGVKSHNFVGARRRLILDDSQDTLRSANPE